MYKHEVDAALSNGKKVRRASWPKSHYIVKVPAGPLTLSNEEKSEFGLSENATVTCAETLIYCEGKNRAVYAHALELPDTQSQDWEEVN